MKFVVCLATLAVAGSLYAGEKWSRVNFNSLTASQAQLLLNDSPWAKEAKASIVTPKRVAGPDDVPMPQPANVPPPGPSYKSDGYGVDDGKWDGGVGRIRAYTPPTVPVLVRWDSSIPVRQALLQTKDPDVRDTANTVNTDEKDYIITVIGLVPAERKKRDDDDADGGQTAEEQAAAQRAELTRIRQGILDSTRLLRPGKRPVIPEDVHLDEASGTLQVFFPRTDPIEAADKEVTFDSQYGTLHVAQSFKLKDMTVQGRLEL